MREVSPIEAGCQFSEMLIIEIKQNTEIFQCGFVMTTRKPAVNYVQHKGIPSWNNCTYTHLAVI